MKYLFFSVIIAMPFLSLSQRNSEDKLWEIHPPSFNSFYIAHGGAFKYSKEQLINFETCVFADTLFVRTSPNLKGIVQDTIFVGDNIKIVDGGEILKIGHREYPWFKISYTDNQNKKKTGFAWGGLISFKALRKGNTKFVYGIPKIIIKGKPSENDSKSIVQIKAVENKKTIAKIEIPINSESSHWSNAIILNNQSLSNISNILLIGFKGEACGIPMYYLYLLWDGQRFYQAPKSETVADAGIFYQSYSLVFPIEKGGINNKVIQNYSYSELVDEDKDKWERINSKTIYSWTGSGFVKD